MRGAGGMHFKSVYHGFFQYCYCCWLFKVRKLCEGILYLYSNRSIGTQHKQRAYIDFGHTITVNAEKSKNTLQSDSFICSFAKVLMLSWSQSEMNMHTHTHTQSCQTHHERYKFINLLYPEPNNYACWH